MNVSVTVTKATCIDGTVSKWGTCGTNAKWTLDQEGTFTVFGSGAMTNYQLNYTTDASYQQNTDGATHSLSAAAGWGEYWSYGVNVKWGHSREEYLEWCELDLSGPDVVLPIGITSIPYRAFAYRSELPSLPPPRTAK